MSINRKIVALTLLTLVALAAVMGGFLLTTQTTDTNDTTETPAENTTTVTTDDGYSVVPDWDIGGMGFGGRGHRCRGGFGGFGLGYGAVEVSAEFEEKVTNIAKSDTDVQQLLDEAYNVTRVMPIVKTIIDGDGNVVSVDLEQEQVTQIIILTRTVIDKSRKQHMEDYRHFDPMPHEQQGKSTSTSYFSSLF
jgi:hypothetical protein